MTKKIESKKYCLNKEDMKKVGKGLLMALGGAVATYAAETIPMVDFGDYQALAVVLGGVIINLLRKVLAGR